VHPEKPIDEEIPLHYGLKPIYVRVVGDQIVDIYVFGKITRYPDTNITLQTSRVMGQEWETGI